MPFLELQIEPRITNGARSTAMWKRLKTYTASGNLNQDFRWEHFKYELDLAYRARTVDEYHALEDFFHVVMAGAYSGFRAKNWSDFEATATNSGVLDVDGVWQLCRKHSVGALVYLKPIKKPIEGTITVFAEGGTEIAADIDYTTGTFTGGAPAYWTGEFDIPVTFVNDEWVGNFKGTAQQMFVSPDPILLEEVRL